jgi:hypothetical protein
MAVILLLSVQIREGGDQMRRGADVCQQIRPLYLVGLVMLPVVPEVGVAGRSAV